MISFVVKGELGKTSKSLKILWNWLSEEFPFFFFINNFFCQKQSYLGYNLLYPSKKCPKTNLKFFWNLNLSEKTAKVVTK